MDIAPKHSGSVFGIINTVGSTSGIQNILKFVFVKYLENIQVIF